MNNFLEKETKMSIVITLIVTFVMIIYFSISNKNTVVNKKSLQYDTITYKESDGDVLKIIIIREK